MFAVLALVIGVGAGLLLAEGLARLTWSAQVPADKGLRPPLVDPSLPTITGVFDLVRPNHRAIHNGRLHRANSLGVRGPEYTPAPAPGVFRIAIGGDSVTMGAGVDEEDAYPQVLARLLDERSDRWRYEVVNLGVSGLNVAAVVDRMQNVGLRYHPNLLVYGWTPNDIEGPAYRQVQGKDPVADRQRYDRLLQSPSYLVRMLGPRLLALRDRFVPPEGSYLRELQINYFENPAAWDAFAVELQRFAAMAAAQRVCGHVFLHHQLTRVASLHPFTPIYDKVAQAARSDHLTVSRAGTYLGAYDEESLRISMWDQHPSPLGHRLYAQALLDALLELPDPCWRTADGSSARPARDPVASP